MSKIDNMVVCIQERFKEIDVEFDKEKLKKNESLIKVVVKLFDDMPDPRIEKKAKYRLCDLLAIIFLGILGGCDTYVEIVMFWNHNIKIYKKIFGYDRVPSHDTMGRILSLIDSEQFQSILFSSVLAVENNIRKAFGVKTRGNRVINIDGKVLRGTGAKSGTSEEMRDVQTLNVFEAGSYTVLCSDEIAEKTNEIKHSQKILKLLNLKGVTVTSDAMNAQTETVEVIVERKGDYVIGLKGNQGTLHNYAKEYFDDITLRLFPEKHPDRYFETVEVAHNNVEKREYFLHLLSPRDRKDFADWKKLRGVLCLRKTSTNKVTNEASIDYRYYITSIVDVEEVAETARLHWNCEITHWFLDMVMLEDAMQVRNRNEAHNRSILNKACVAIYRYYRLAKGENYAIKSIRKSVGWDFSFTMKEMLTLLNEKSLLEVMTFTPKN